MKFIKVLSLVCVVLVLLVTCISCDSLYRYKPKAIELNGHHLNLQLLFGYAEISRGINIACIDGFEFIVTCGGGIRIVQVMDENNKPKRCKNYEIVEKVVEK